jgi:phosphotriesterase-related protein
MAAHVVTVMGPIAPSAMGVTLPHEHLISDVSNYPPEPDSAVARALSRRPVDITLLGALKRNPHAVRDNLRLDDVELAIREASCFKRAGGNTIVEVTPIGVGRDARALRAISAATGLNVVMGTAYYDKVLQPPVVAQMSQGDIADVFVGELAEGVDGTGIRAGIIGELGLSSPIHPEEEKVLRAAACAQKETGAAISVHLFFGREGKDALRILREEAADLERVIMCHVDNRLELDYHKALADSGATLEFDGFGIEWYTDQWDVYPPRDTERIATLARLLDAGYVSQLLLSQDIFTKMQLRQYGGWGYDHILTNVVPMFKRAGISETQVQVMMVHNPARLLAIP